MQKELESNINSLNYKISKASKVVSKNLNDIFLIAVSKKKSIAVSYTHLRAHET